MANTTNFNWETPDDTDLVKDGAAAMRTLGNAIDASFVDLKGGTTGQVLSKASNTDLDYTWVTTDDANAIQNAIVDAKGDLISATAADTPARLAVGNNGETLVADSSATTGLRWQGNFAAGKNAIINGDFRINQRGFSSTTTSGTFGFDRFYMVGTATTTYSAQTFTAGTAPVAGYEGINFARLVTSGHSAASAAAYLSQKIEDVRTFANQTVTVSFWAKAGSGTPKVGINLLQQFGSGGSSEVIAPTGSVTLSTSWARYSLTIAVPSISGKTIGTGSNLQLLLWTSAGTDYASYTNIGVQNATIDFWGVQVEAGSVATAFQTATGTLAGELAACQRYYIRIAGGGDGQSAPIAGSGFGDGGVNIRRVLVPTPTTMRSAPSIAKNGTAVKMYSGNLTSLTISSLSTTYLGRNNVSFDVVTTTNTTSNVGYFMIIDSTSASDYFEMSSEL